MREPLPKELYDILACPACKCGLKYTGDKKGLLCSKCKEKYAIKNGVPVLLPKK